MRIDITVVFPLPCDNEDTFRRVPSPVDYSLVVVVSSEVGCGTDTTGSGGRLALVEPVQERLETYQLQLVHRHLSTSPTT